VRCDLGRVVQCNVRCDVQCDVGDAVTWTTNLAVDFEHNFDAEKKIDLAGVLSRIWYLGPWNDLRSRGRKKT
jgi:hypothetical protein